MDNQIWGYFYVENIGQMQVITEKFSKAVISGYLGNMAVEVDFLKWHIGSIEEGRYYELEVQPNGQYNGTIQKISEVAAPEPEEENIVIPSNVDQPAAAPVQPKPQFQRVPPREPVVPDFNRRFTEWSSTNLRTAQMQATERVQTKVSLLIAGKLSNDEGTPIQSVRESTLQKWYEEELWRFTKYVMELPAEDQFGSIG